MTALLISLSIAVVVLGLASAYLINQVFYLYKEITEIKVSIYKINDIIVHDWKGKVIPLKRPKK